MRNLSQENRTYGSRRPIDRSTGLCRPGTPPTDRRQRIFHDVTRGKRRQKSDPDDAGSSH